MAGEGRYTTDYSDDGFKLYQKLPEKVLLVVIGIQRELTEDPRRYPQRMTRLGDKEDIYMYQHPNPNLQITYRINETERCITFVHFGLANFRMMETLFISYSHKDEDWLVKVKTFLSNLEQQGMVRFLDDTQLQAGEKWRPQIDALLESARAAILLVSQDFLASNFIHDTELPALLKAAEKEGKKIF